MHSKMKGNIGQFGTSLHLSKLGYSIFTEEGDVSKIDLIAEKGGKFLTFQCKAITPVNGKLPLKLGKSGPNYQFKYSEGMFDFFAVYDLVSDKLYLVHNSILKDRSSDFVLRLSKTKNSQVIGVNFAENYLAERVLRD